MFNQVLMPLDSKPLISLLWNMLPLLSSCLMTHFRYFIRKGKKKSAWSILALWTLSHWIPFPNLQSNSLIPNHLPGTGMGRNSNSCFHLFIYLCLLVMILGIRVPQAQNGNPALSQAADELPGTSPAPVEIWKAANFRNSCRHVSGACQYGRKPPAIEFVGRLFI